MVLLFVIFFAASSLCPCLNTIIPFPSPLAMGYCGRICMVSSAYIHNNGLQAKLSHPFMPHVAGLVDCFYCLVSEPEVQKVWIHQPVSSSHHKPRMIHCSYLSGPGSYLEMEQNNNKQNDPL